MAIVVVKNPKGNILMETDYTSWFVFLSVMPSITNTDYKQLFISSLRARGYTPTQIEQTGGLGSHVNTNEFIITVSDNNKINTFNAFGLGCLSILLYGALIWSGAKFDSKHLQPVMACTTIAASAFLGHCYENSDRFVLGLPIVNWFKYKYDGLYLYNALKHERASHQSTVKFKIDSDGNAKQV